MGLTNKEIATRSLSFTSVLPSVLENAIPNNATEEASLYATYLDGGNAEIFRNNSKSFTFPKTITPSNARVMIDNKPVKVNTIILNGKSSISIASDQGNINLELPIVPMDDNSDAGKEAGNFIYRALSGAEKIYINPVRDKLQSGADNTRNVIGGISFENGGVVGSLERGLALYAIAPPSTALSNASYFPTQDRTKQVTSVQELRRIYGNSVRDGIGTSNAREVTEKILTSAMASSNRPKNVENIKRGRRNKDGELEGNFNDRSVTNRSLKLRRDGTFTDKEYTFKIGDVILHIPPTNLTICQLRSSTETSMIGFHSFTSASPTVRITFKINCIFTGGQIDDDLKRLITQFIYCPFNIIHSQDLFNLLIAEDSTLLKSLVVAETVPYVPVTMDDYTIYTVENHPDTVGCTMQFSLFNYMPYFDGDVTESFKYTRMEFDDKGIGKFDGKVKTTTHLEHAIHPYNFDILDILRTESRRWYGKEPIEGDADDIVKNNSRVTMHKLTSFQDVDFDILSETIFNSEINFHCESMSVRYENHFAWFPIGGYSQAIAQYIGPGSSCITFNAKVNLDEKTTINRLLNTYHETRSKDINQFYDDRYLVYSSMTKLTDCLIASITDVAITSLPQHPGYSDVNIMLRKSPYVNNTLNSVKVAEPDYYFGMQRIIRAVEGNAALLDEVKSQLGKERDEVFSKFGFLAQWAENNGTTNLLPGIHEVVIQLVNEGASYIDKSTTTTAKEKIIINRIKLLSGGVINISELIADLDGWGRGTGGVRRTTYSALTVIIGIKNNEDPFWRDFIYKVITKYSDIFSVKAAEGRVLERATAFAATVAKTVSQEHKNKLWNSKDTEDIINALLKSGNIQPSYDFTRLSLSELQDEAKNKYPPIRYVCDEDPKEGIIKEDIYNVYIKLKNYLSDKSVVGLSIDTVESPESNVQYVMLKNAEKDSKSSLFKLKKAVITKDSDALASQIISSKSKINVPPPFAAHRYYPQCDAMVSIDPRFSSTIGSYFFSNIVGTDGHFYKMINNFKKEIENSISPAFDFPAYKALFPDQSDASVLYEKAKNENNPFYLLQALAMPELRKEINVNVSKYLKGKGDVLRATPTMEMQVRAIGTFADEEKAIDKPFSGLSDWIFLSKIGNATAGSPASAKIRENMHARKELTFAALVGSPDANARSKETPSSAFYRYMNLGLGVVLQDNKTLMNKSDTTTFGTNKIGSVDTTFDSPQNKEYHYKHIAIHGENFLTANSNARLITPKGDNNDINPTTPVPENVSKQTTENAIKQLSSRLSDRLTIYGDKMGIYFKDPNDTANVILRYLYSSTLTEAEIYSISEVEIDAAIGAALFIFIETNGDETRFIHNKTKRTSGKWYYSYEYALLETIVVGKTRKTSKERQASPTSQIIFDVLLLQLAQAEIAAIVGSAYATKRYNRNYKDIIQLDSDEKRIKLLFSATQEKEEISLLSLPLPLFKYMKYGPEAVKSRSSILEEFKLALKVHCRRDKNVNDEYNNTIEEVCNKIKNAITQFLVATSIEFTLTDSKTNPAVNVKVADNVHPGTGSFLISQFMNGMLPTFGMQNAFPTYKMYIIDQNLSDLRFHSLDIWYDFRLAKDLMIIKSKEDPAHMLKCRVIVDERFITTNILVPQRDADRNPIESKDPSPTAETVGTQQEASFYGGKAPLRVGMRICVKLGYHTDPRLLDTVFIGTISGLQGSMEMNVFDLEAYGDGRELSTAASLTSESIQGNNYSEIIAKMLRSNPAVFHLGRNYGTQIERFTREHHILYGFARSCVNGLLETKSDIKSLLLYGNSEATGMNHNPHFAVAAATAAAGTVVNAGITVGMLSPYGAGASVMNSLKLMRESHLVPQAREEWSRQLSTRLKSDNANGKYFNFKRFINGATFDAGKASGQIFKTFHDTFRYGNDPIDDNIWAVDIWARFTNIDIWKTAYDIKATNSVTTWQILQGIKRVYPNYALDVRPYGSRSTLYFGPLNWLMWRTDDPVLAMLPQMDQISNDSIINKIGSYYDNLNTQDEFFVSNTTNAMPPLVEFQKTHMASSDSNIIFNGITSTPERGWNAVVVNCGGESYDVTANAELHPGIIRTKIDNVTWTDNGYVAQQYALGLLKEGVEKMYGGTLALRGNPKIEPYDRIYIADKINRMSGWIEVETVIHKFDNNFGYTTHITPNMVCAVNSNAYKTTSQLIRSMMTSRSTLAAAGSFLSGMAWGAGISTGLGVAATIAGVASAPILAALSVIGAAVFVGVAGFSIVHSIKASADILSGDITRSNDADILAILEAAHKDSLYVSAYNHGIWYGILAGNIVKIYNAGFSKTWMSTKDFGKANFRIISRAMGNAWAYPAAINFFSLGRESTVTITSISRLVSKYSESVAKLAGKDKVIMDVKDFNSSKFSDITRAREVLNTQLTDLESIKNPSEEVKALKKEISQHIKKLDSEMPALKKLIDPKTGLMRGARKQKVFTPDITKGVAPARTIISGLFKMSFYGFILETINIIPDLLETYMLNYMTKANCISISPLWSKNNLMIAGLDGFQKTNAFMHMRNMAVFAKRILDDVDRSALYSLPKFWDQPIPSEMQRAVDRKIAKNKIKPDNLNRTQVKALVLSHKAVAEAAVEKFKKDLKYSCPEVKALFTAETVLSIMDYESSGRYWIPGSAPDGSTEETGRGLMQLTAKHQYDRFLRNGTPELQAKFPNLIKNKKITGTKPTSEELISIRNEMLKEENIEANVYAGTEYMVNILNTEIEKYQCGTADGGTLEERLYRAYVSGTGWRAVRNDKPKGYNVTNEVLGNSYLLKIKEAKSSYVAEKNTPVTSVDQPITASGGTIPSSTTDKPTQEKLLAAARGAKPGSPSSTSLVLDKYISDIFANKYPGIGGIDATKSPASLALLKVGDIITLTHKFPGYRTASGVCQIISRDSEGINVRDENSLNFKMIKDGSSYKMITNNKESGIATIKSIIFYSPTGKS